MFAVGVLYLLFEDALLGRSEVAEGGVRSNGFSRTVLGLQASFIFSPLIPPKIY